jgi:hypothetical protein
MTVPFRSPPQLRLRREAVCGGTSQPSSCVGGSWALSGTISSVSMLTSSNDQIGGVLRHPRTPQMRPRVRRRRNGWLSGPQSNRLAFPRPFRPARCTKCRPAVSELSLPWLGVGAGSCIVIEPAPLVGLYPIWSRISVRPVLPFPARFARRLSCP